MWEVGGKQEGGGARGGEDLRIGPGSQNGKRRAGHARRYTAATAQSGGGATVDEPLPSGERRSASPQKRHLFVLSAQKAPIKHQKLETKVYIESVKMKIQNCA